MEEVILFGKEHTDIISFEDNTILHTFHNNDLIGGIYYKNHIIVHKKDYIVLYYIVSNQNELRLTEVSKIPCKYICLTKPCIVSTLTSPVYTFVTSNTCIIQIPLDINNLNRLMFGTLMKYYIIDNLGYEIKYITHQDMYIYSIQYDNTSCKYYLVILEPSIKVFGKIELPEFNKEPLLVGKNLYYITTKNDIANFCLLEKNISYINTSSIDGIIHTFTILDTDEYFILSEKYIGLYTHIDNKLVSVKSYDNIKNYTKYIIPDEDTDYSNHMCNLNNCLVKTYYKNQLNADCKSICEIMTETASIIYRSEKLKKLCNNHANARSRVIKISQFRPNQNGVYFASSLKDIIKPSENIFKRPHNYQHMLNDMIHFVDDEDMSIYPLINKDAFNNENIDMIKQFVIQKGVFILPYYEMSGRFHYIIPNYAKGWHHNIESVPDKLCDVIYFVATDVSEYGGSFFLYRHIVSKKIHAVPDIHGTMKQFFLRSDINSPLWHAIFSFKAHRLSVGFSKKRDLQSNNLFPRKDDFSKPTLALDI